MSFIRELRIKSPLLFWFGLFNLLAGILCAVMTQLDHQIVLGINAWIKPMKFFISIFLFSVTMGWYLPYLKRPKKAMRYSVMVILVMLFETSVITWQAANGRLSHFNNSTPLYGLLFALMGLAITILTIWTGYIGFLFFRQEDIDLPATYLWGIRLGILCFVIFAFEGGVMASLLHHTIGAADGGEGWPVLNWSKIHGDLRVAHFFGMHSLQVFPLAGYYLVRTNRQLFFFAGCYFLLVLVFFIEALNGIPVI